MFVVLLKFSEQKARAGEFMEAHNAWIQRGFDDGVFLLVGSLQPAAGGALLADGADREELQRRLDEDPFVVHGVVTAQIHEITPGRVDQRLSFLRAGRPPAMGAGA